MAFDRIPVAWALSEVLDNAYKSEISQTGYGLPEKSGVSAVADGGAARIYRAQVRAHGQALSAKLLDTADRAVISYLELRRGSFSPLDSP